MPAFEIPLSAQPQTFQISLAGVTYGMTVTWCDPGQNWTIALYDANGNLRVAPLPLVTGADLLAQYGYLGIGGQLIAQTDNNPAAPPTFANLGTTGHLYFVTS